MSKPFVYNTNPNQFDPQTVQAPIFSDFSYTSEVAQRMMKAKQVNDSNYWPTMCKTFAHDFATLPKNRFKVWASVWNVPFISMSRFFPYVQIVSEHIVKNPLIAEAVKEPMVGCTPSDFQQHLQLFPDFPTTMNRVQHMAHLLICKYTPEQLSKMETIVELGGGIGEMTDIIYKLGFRGKYIIYDFKEVGAIQKYHHDQLGYTNVVHTNNVDDLVDADLCIATWSLTEMPLDLREEILPNIKNTKNWLIAYSNLIFSLNNDKYIKESLVPNFTNHDVEYHDIPFMPWDGGGMYVTIKEKV